MAISYQNNVLALKGQRNPGTLGNEYKEVGYVEVDFGPKPVDEITVTVYDDRVNSSTRVTAHLSYEAPTGKEIDEVLMDQLDILAGNSGDRFFELVIRSRDGSYLHDTFVIGYSLIDSDTTVVLSDDMNMDSGEVI